MTQLLTRTRIRQMPETKFFGFQVGSARRLCLFPKRHIWLADVYDVAVCASSRRYLGDGVAEATTTATDWFGGCATCMHEAVRKGLFRIGRRYDSWYDIAATPRTVRFAARQCTADVVKRQRYDNEILHNNALSLRDFRRLLTSACQHTALYLSASERNGS